MSDYPTKLRILLCSAAMLLVTRFALAQDIFTAGGVRAVAGTSAAVPLTIRDVSGAPLSVNRGNAARIQAISFRITATPAASVTSLSFERAGVLLPLTPLYERTAGVDGSIGYIATFSVTSDPIPFVLNAGAGNRIGTLLVGVAPGLADGARIDLTFDTELTMLANQAGTVVESVYNHKLTLMHGAIVVGGAATALTLSSSPNPSAAGNNVTFTATVTPAVAGTVAFRNGAQLLGHGTLSNGVATLVTSSLPEGTHTITAAYEGGGDFLGSQAAPLNQTVGIPPIAAPATVNAAATSSTSVQVSWAPVGGAASYEIARSSNGGAFQLAGISAVTSFTDGGRTAGVTYLYVVRAVDSGGAKSLDSVKDAATTVMFTDDPLAAGTTKAKRVHMSELRTAINAYRAGAGLAAASFTDPTLTAATVIKGVHVEELRAALQAARTAYGLSTLTFTDASLAGMRVKAIHFTELRNAVK
jgi:hypothetical protein